MKLRILLADDHVLMRSGLRKLLEEIEDVTVVAEAGDGHEVLALAAVHRPDIVLLDLSMPRMNGMEATLRLRKEQPQVKIIVLSMHETKEYVLRALRSGVRGYLLKDAAAIELALALQAVGRGETYLSPPISRQVMENYARGFAPADEPLAVLTLRQREILQLIAEGSTTKDVARKLNLSVKTVETHRTQLMNRLGIHDVTGLVRFAVRHGLIGTEK